MKEVSKDPYNTIISYKRVLQILLLKNKLKFTPEKLDYDMIEPIGKTISMF